MKTTYLNLLLCSAAALFPHSVPASKIYWTTWNAGQTDGIYQADRDGTGVVQLVSPEDLQPPDFSIFVGFPMGLQVDPSNEYLYFVSTSDDTIWRTDFEASEFIPVHEPSGDDPHQIVLDLAHGHIFWVEDNGRDSPARLGRSDLQGGNEVILIDEAGARAGGIAIDPANGYLFWTESYYSPDPVSLAVWRCDLDGANPQPIVSEFDEGTFDLGSIAVDTEARKVYYLQDQKKIQRANYDGSGVELFHEEETLGDRSHIAIDTTTDELFWTSINAPIIGRATLDGSAIGPLISGLDTPTFGIAVAPAGENPVTPPTLTNIRHVRDPDAGSRFQFEFQTESGVRYSILHKPSLTAGDDWSALEEVTGDGAPHTVNAPLDQTMQIYGVSASP